MRQLAVGLIFGLFAVAASAGEVYKWTDADGKVHYGDKPKAVNAEQVNAKPVSVSDQLETPEDAKATAARAANCEARKKQLDSYKSASTIKETDSLGNVREYSAEDKQKLLALTEKQVAEACAPPPTAAK